MKFDIFPRSPISLPLSLLEEDDEEDEEEDGSATP